MTSTSDIEKNYGLSRCPCTLGLLGYMLDSSTEKWDTKLLLECMCTVIAPLKHQSKMWLDLFDFHDNPLNVDWKAVSLSYCKALKIDHQAAGESFLAVLADYLEKKQYRDVMCVVLIKLAEAMDLEPESCLCHEIYERGMSLIENHFLVLGQPLSLPVKIYEQSLFPNALCGEDTLEDLETYFKRNRRKFGLEQFLEATDENQMNERCDAWKSGESLKEELSTLKAERQKLRFMNMYFLKEYTKDLDSRTSKLQQKVKDVEARFISASEKEDAETKVARLLGGTNDEVTHKLSFILNEIVVFKATNDGDAFLERIRDLIGNLPEKRQAKDVENTPEIRMPEKTLSKHVEKASVKRSIFSPELTPFEEPCKKARLDAPDSCDTFLPQKSNTSSSQKPKSPEHAKPCTPPSSSSSSASSSGSSSSESESSSSENEDTDK